MGVSGVFQVLCSVTVALAINFTAKVSADCNLTSETGVYLTGHAYASFSVQDFQECYEKCKAGKEVTK